MVVLGKEGEGGNIGGKANTKSKRYIALSISLRYVFPLLDNASSMWVKVIASDSYRFGNIATIITFESTAIGIQGRYRSVILQPSSLLIVVVMITEAITDDPRLFFELRLPASDIAFLSLMLYRIHRV